MGRKRIDITGQRFGRLTVVEFSHPDKHGYSRWLCKCDCNNEKIIYGTSLKRGLTKSCGCLRGLPKGMAARNAVISSHKCSAKRRNLEWVLTNEQVIALHEGNCNYCGAPPSNIMIQPDCKGSYTYSGIDRVDNDKGYTIDNVVSCCEGCNGAKEKKSVDEFLDLVKRIHSHLGL